MAGDAITVNVITGFLGSGKTTLLRRLLAAPGLRDTAVLVNEFGEVGLDHHLLQRLDEATVLLRSGCLCCTIRGDLRDSIRDLMDRRERGAVPAFHRLAIETTGLADPAPIVATLANDPVIAKHFRLGNIVTVVDAVNGLANLARFAESMKQAAVADRLVVSKTDLADSAAVAALTAALRRLNPTAAIVDGADARLRPETLLTHDVHNPRRKAAEVRQWIAEAEAGPDHDHGGHDVNRHGDIATFCVVRERPLDWAAFALWLTMLLNRHGQDILRVKGLLRIAGVATPVVIHGVQHTIHRPAHLAAWPDGEARTRLVFIARGLTLGPVERSLAAFDALAAA